MASNNLAKKVFVLIFLLIVLVAIFVWQGNGFSQGYLSWLKTGIAKYNPFNKMIGPELELDKDSGLDLSEVNIEEIIAEQPEVPEEEKIEEVPPEEIVVIEDQEEKEEEEEEEAKDLVEEVIIGIGGPIESIIEDSITLEEIEQEVNRITKEVERIDKDVQALVALYE